MSKVKTCWNCDNPPLALGCCDDPVCLRSKIKHLKQRCREATQLIISEIGSDGPEDLEDALARLMVKYDDTKRGRPNEVQGIPDGLSALEYLTFVACEREGGGLNFRQTRAVDQDMKRLVQQANRMAKLEEALTPSAETKAEYMGELQFQFPEKDPETGEDYMRNINVPWTIQKEFMAMILKRANR